jgi:hypothetical protein
MKQLLCLLCTVLFFSCNTSKTKKESVDIPAAPTGVDAVAQTLKGKNYSVLQVATISNFEMNKDNPYDWMDGKKDTTAFSRNYVTERMKLKLNFVNDTTVSFTDEDKLTEAKYKLDTLIGDEEKPGIKLRISYLDSSITFPSFTEPRLMTYTYRVLGINNESLLLETPRSFNNRKIAVLMKPNK